MIKQALSKETKEHIYISDKTGLTFYQLHDTKYFNSIINLFSVFINNNNNNRVLRISYRIDDSSKRHTFPLSGEEISRRPKHKAKDETLMQRSNTAYEIQ
jgi:hypothetical protein